MAVQTLPCGAPKPTPPGGSCRRCFHAMDPTVWNYVKEVIGGGLTGNTVKEFEEAFARELGVRHVIATPTCTPAMAALGQLANSPRTGKRSRR